MNIEKLANAEFEYIATHNKYLVSLQELTKFAQLLTQQEPVVELSEFAKAPIGKILPHGEIDLYDDIQTINEMVGFEIYIHPQDKTNFPPPDTQAKLDKAREALREIADVNHTSAMCGKLAQQALKDTE
jgi:hypothetical protein